MPGQSDIGIVGLAVMGQSLATSIVGRGFQVSVCNRTRAVTDAFIQRHPGRQLRAAHDAAALARSLVRPRRILLSVQAGPAVDEVLDSLLPHLSSGDIVVDTGDSAWPDTERRQARMATRGVQLLGCGMSGGEAGARRGWSIMPGGPRPAWEALRPLLEALAARVDGEPCVAWIGPGGAGHLVKTVHNGLEYAEMQLLAEAYHLLKASGIGHDEATGIFQRWNEGPLQGYLVQSTARVLAQIDPETGQPVVELVQDKAGQKGTGRWALAGAAEQGVPVGVLQAAVEARIVSTWKAVRVQAGGCLVGPALVRAMPKKRLIGAVHDAVLASRAIAYAQGMDLLAAVSAAQGWSLDRAAIAAIWRGGCIIRGRFLERVAQALKTDPPPAHLALTPELIDVLNGAQLAWREVVAMAVTSGIPVPAMGAALAHYDSLRTARLPANLIQAQRDLFGAHAYERVDRPEGQFFHTLWPETGD